MSEGKPELAQRRSGVRRLEDLFLGVEDRECDDFEPFDVFEGSEEVELDLDPERTGELFELDPSEWMPLWGTSGEVSEAPSESAAQNLLSERAARASSRAARTFQDRALIGMLVANICLVGLMIMRPANVADSAKPVTPGTMDLTGILTPEGTTPTSTPTSNWVPEQATSPEGRGVMPDLEGYEAAQAWVRRGHYEKASTLLEQYVSKHGETGTKAGGLSSLQLQSVYSSLAYCAQRLGDLKRASAYNWRVENLRLLAATPEVLWDEAQKAEQAKLGEDARRTYARVLLMRDRLPLPFGGEDVLDAARAAIGHTYRSDSESLSRSPVSRSGRSAKVIR